MVDGARIRQELDKGQVVIVAGFQGLTPNNDIATLGRGGSDTTAVAVAAALDAAVCGSLRMWMECTLPIPGLCLGLGS